MTPYVVQLVTDLIVIAIFGVCVFAAIVTNKKSTDRVAREEANDEHHRAFMQKLNLIQGRLLLAHQNRDGVGLMQSITALELMNPVTATRSTPPRVPQPPPAVVTMRPGRASVRGTHR